MLKQKTIKKEICIKGKKLSNGKKTSIIFKPCKTGLFIEYKKKKYRINYKILNNNETRYLNSIILDNEIIFSVEHIFSAVFGLGIDNLIIEFTSNEPPFFANSEFIAKKLNENILVLNKDKKFISIKNKIKISDNNGRYCIIEPSKTFKVKIKIDFDNLIGKQEFYYSYDSTDYMQEISYARSILIFKISEKRPWKNYKEHFEKLPSIFPKDPKHCPFIAYNNEKFLTELKNELEPVGHKLLDFIGDMIFLGAFPKMKFEIYKPGHSFNRKIVNKIIHQILFEQILDKISEIKSLNKIIENNNVHKNETVFSHTEKVFQNCFNILIEKQINFSDKKLNRFLVGIFLHDFGKINTFEIYKNNSTECKNHEKESVKQILKFNFLERFDFSPEDKKWILDFIKNHTEIHKFLDNKNNKLSAQKFKRIKHIYFELLIFSIGDIKGSFYEKYDKLDYNRRIEILEREININLNNKK